MTRLWVGYVKEVYKINLRRAQILLSLQICSKAMKAFRHNILFREIVHDKRGLGKALGKLTMAQDMVLYNAG